MSYDELGQLVAEVLPGNRTTQIIYDELGNTVQQTDAMGGITSQKWNIFGELVEVTNANSNLIEENNPSSGITQYEYDAANQLIQKVNAKGDQTTYQYDLAGQLTTEITTATGSTTPSQIVTYLYNDAGQLVDVKQTGATNSRYQYSLDALGRTTEETVTYGTGSEAITQKLGYGYDQENRLSSFKYPEGSELQYHYDKANLKSTQLANGESIEWKNYQWFSPTEINTPNVKQQNQYDALMSPTSIQVNANNGQNAQNPLMKRDYQYNAAGNITSRNTEKGKVNYRYDQLDRLIEATPDTSLQAIGLPNEGYTYDAIGNRLGSRHQPGSWQYNGQDQLMSWGTGSQAETLSYTATGQLKQNKKTLETLDYDYDATDRLTEVKRNDITLANYQYDPFGRRMSKEVNGERTYFLYSDEGLIAELNDRGNTQVAYGWLPDSSWGTNPLWQANLATGQTLKNAAYHYLHTDHLGTPQIATNQAGNITWQAEAEAFGATHLNESNQITMNLRFPGQYYDTETDTHYNYFRDYNPKTGRYQQSDPIGVLGGINHYGYVGNNPLISIDFTGLKKKPGNIAQARIGSKYEYDSAKCESIEKSIKNLTEQLYDKRYPDLEINPSKLPYKATPGTKIEETVQGHEIEIVKVRRYLDNKWEDWYDYGCDDPPPPSSGAQSCVTTNVDAKSSSQTNSNSNSSTQRNRGKLPLPLRLLRIPALILMPDPCLINPGSMMCNGHPYQNIPDA